MKREKDRTGGAILAVRLLLCALILGVLAFSLVRFIREQDSAGRETLETSVRRAAMACYASEGVYPPDLAYLQEHYGLQINETRYAVQYVAFAENLMPDITVLKIDS